MCCLREGVFTPEQTSKAASYYCTTHIEEVKRQRHLDKNYKTQYLSNQCLIGLYTPILFTKGYGFRNNTKQIFAKQEINNQAAEWPLGAIIYEQERKGGICRQCQLSHPPKKNFANALHSSSFLNSVVLLISLLLALSNIPSRLFITQWYFHLRYLCWNEIISRAIWKTANHSIQWNLCRCIHCGAFIFRFSLGGNFVTVLHYPCIIDIIWYNLEHCLNHNIADAYNLKQNKQFAFKLKQGVEAGQGTLIIIVCSPLVWKWFMIKLD